MQQEGAGEGQAEGDSEGHHHVALRRRDRGHDLVRLDLGLIVVPIGDDPHRVPGLEICGVALAGDGLIGNSQVGRDRRLGHLRVTAVRLGEHGRLVRLDRPLEVRGACGQVRTVLRTLQRSFGEGVVLAQHAFQLTAVVEAKDIVGEQGRGLPLDLRQTRKG